MTGAFEVRPFAAGDEHALLALFNEVFAEDDPNFRPRSLAHWRWQFEDNPRGHQTFVAAERDGSAGAGRLIGLYTAIPAVWLHHGRPFLGAQAVDTCVHREYRRVLKREGLFLTLARAWFDEYGRPERDSIVYGFPNPQAFRVGTRLLDYRPVHVPVVALVRDFRDDWVEYLGGMGADRVTVEEVRAIPADAGALFERAMAALPLVLRRDEAYLDWRYRRCPTHGYRLLAARAGGELRGLLAFRTAWFDRPLAPLVDWVVDGADQAAVAGLVQAAARAAAAAGKARLETWAPPWSSLWATLRTLGFAPEDSRFNLCIRVFGLGLDEAWARDHWFFTMGDSDIY